MPRTCIYLASLIQPLFDPNRYVTRTNQERHNLIISRFFVAHIYFQQTTTAAQDCEAVLSAAKAKELGVAAGDVILLIGRRRRAAYARVQIGRSDLKTSSCTIRSNMAANLRLRQDDKIKIELLRDGISTAGNSGDAEKDLEDKNRSGDLTLLLQKKPSAIRSATFSPVEDSISALVASEGGDTIPDEELQERFVAPYLVGDAGLLKQGNIVTLIDENGKRLEFYITQIELDEEEDTAEVDKGKEAKKGTAEAARTFIFAL
jgi:hypothetical protein